MILGFDGVYDGLQTRTQLSDYLDWVRDPANGFLTLSPPFKRTFELSVKVK